MVEVRGLVLHIAVGWYDGTIAWQLNPDSDVSSHFIAGRDQGELAQMVDTADRAWTQGDGNGRWLSSENEGFLASDSRNPGGWERLSSWQVEANAQLFARGHLEYGYPLKVADHPGELGLGHHSMDREWLDEQWGHDQCPGAAIVAQKPEIVRRAIEIVEGSGMPLTDADARLVARHVWKDDVVSSPVSAATHKSNPEWQAESYLASIRNHAVWARDDISALRELVVATLAAREDLDTGQILTRLDEHAAAAAAARQAQTDQMEATLARMGPELAEELREVPVDRVEQAFVNVLSRVAFSVAPAGSSVPEPQ
jgi:hypothetical protein